MSDGDTKLELMISAFSKVKKQEDAERLGKKLWGFVLNYRLEQLGHLKSSEKIKKQINAKTTKIALEWDTDDASLAIEQKLMNRLARGDFIGAIKLAESSVEAKRMAINNTKLQNATHTANEKHKSNNKIREQAIEYFLNNRSEYLGRGGKKRAAIDLEILFPPLKYSTYLQHLKKFK